MSLAGIYQALEAEIGGGNAVDTEEVCEVMVVIWGCVSRCYEREFACKLFGFTHRKSVNPQNCSPRVVRPVPRSRIHHRIGTKTRMEGGDDQTIWGLYVSPLLEPPNRASESDGGVECVLVGDAPDDPRDASHIVGARPLDRGQILRCSLAILLGRWKKWTAEI